MVKPGKVDLIVDAAHGSSGKGAVSTRLVDVHGIKNVSSCNYPNAGHTTQVNGKKFVAKALPTAAGLNAFGMSKPTLWVGPGSGFEFKQLAKELEETGYSLADRQYLRIHERAVSVEERHVLSERGGAQSTEHLASTMSGSGAAFADKAMRTQLVKLARDLPQLSEVTLAPNEFIRQFRAELAKGNSFVHEVSQGYALSADYGTHYPQCTFRNCTPQQAIADLMLDPKSVGDIYLNVRSFPIRVGNVVKDGVQTGYSGDFCADQVELTWEQVARDAEMPEAEAKLLAERERTTVTKRIRRVATQSWSLLEDAARNCCATKLVLNFPQYIHWSAHGLRGGYEMRAKLHPKVREYVDKMEDVTGLPVTLIGTGAEHDQYIYLE